MKRRSGVLVMVLLVWMPLLLLSIAEGHACGDGVRLPFLHDVELHVRLLIALPLMILAELVVHQRMRPVVGQFLDRGLIPNAARPQFDAAIGSAFRLRNSVAAEVLLIRSRSFSALAPGSASSGRAPSSPSTILLGLLDEGKGRGSRILARTGVALDDSRGDILGRLADREKVPESEEIPFSAPASVRCSTRPKKLTGCCTAT